MLFRGHRPLHWAALMLLLGACSEPAASSLLTVSGVAPDRVEGDKTASITGAGFRAGSEARVHLQGSVRRPGASPQDVDVTLRARAVSGDRVDVRDTEELVTALGGYGTFHGAVAVSLLSTAGTEVLRGENDGVTFAVNDGVFVETHPELTRSAEAWLAAVGMGAEETTSEGTGLLVTKAGTGRAAAAGVLDGDVIVSADGVRVSSLEDLAPADDGDVSLTLQRGEITQTVTVAKAATPAAHGMLGEGRLSLGALLLVMLALLLFAAPSLGPAAEAAGEARLAVSFRRRALEVALLAVAALAVVAASVWRRSAPHLGLGWILALAFHPSVVALLRPRVGAAESKLRSLALALTSTMPLLASLIVVWLWRGGLSASAVMEETKTAPWTWPLWQHPALFVLAPLAVTEGARAVRRAESLPAVYGWLQLFAWADLLAVLFFGGWTGPTVLAAALLFVGKVLLAATLLWTALPMPERHRPWTTTLSVTVALTSYVALMRGHDPSAALGVPLFVLSAAAVAWHALRRGRRAAGAAVVADPALLL